MKIFQGIILLVLAGGICAGCSSDSKRAALRPAEPNRSTPASSPHKSEPLKPIDPEKSTHLMGRWGFDETAGATASDGSSHQRGATLQGGLSFENDSVPGRLGRALRLDGRDDHLEIVGYKGVLGPSPRTVTAWIKTDTKRGEIASWGLDEFGRRFTFRIVRSGIYTDPRGGYLYTKSPVHDNRWHHVAVVVLPAERPNLHDHVRLYKDGLLQEIHDIGLLDLWPIDTRAGVDLRLGRGFKGLLDEVRLYDCALTDDQIKTLASPVPSPQ